ncbi:MAG: hypothetical protein ACLUSP_02405 [Christensenellales bacterium]
MLTKVRNNKIISKIDGFFQGRLYPVVVALVVFAVHCLGLDSVGFLLLSAAMAFINVCCGNTRPMVATALFIVMCVSMQNSPGTVSEESPTTTAGLPLSSLSRYAPR